MRENLTTQNAAASFQAISEDFKVALYSLPDKLLTLERAIRFALFLDEPAKALAELRSISHPESVEPYYSLIKVRCLIDLKDYTQAQSMLEKMSKKDPWCADTVYLIGETQLYTRQYKSAVATFTTCLQLKSPATLFNTAICAMSGRAIALTFLGRESSASIDINLLSWVEPLKQALDAYWTGDFKKARVLITGLTPALIRHGLSKFAEGLILQANGAYPESLRAFIERQFELPLGDDQ